MNTYNETLLELPGTYISNSKNVYCYRQEFNILLASFSQQCKIKRRKS
jgi:hypothetical protein